MVLPATPTVSEIADCIASFREQRPHVHCITNSVVQNLTANILLAAGATPSMTVSPGEIAGFVDAADALLVNLGTMDDERTVSIDRAIEIANADQMPWVLDPVFVQASPLRLAQAKSLLDKKPSACRFNEAEGRALFDESLQPSTLQKFAAAAGLNLVLSGQVDLVATRDHRVSCANGSATMQKVTGMGCALTALMACFLAIERKPQLAILSALVLFGIAGERADAQSNGPGSFVPALLDNLANLDRNAIEELARIQ